jgi:nucleoside-diphosphate-sugar epimerase
LETVTQKILVTGATGFIGRTLLPRLIAEGRQVRAAVRERSGRLPVGAESVRVGEIGPDTDWRAALAGVDAVVHLAARAHVLDEASTDAFALYRSVNALGASKLAEAAAAAGVRRFVFLSSVRAHGARTTGTPLTEASPLAAEDPYGRSKAEAELGLAQLARGTKLEPVVLRPPLVYGAEARGNFARLVKLVSRGIPLPLGAVRNQRSLLYVGNLVDAIVRVLHDPAAARQTFLVSDGEDVSTRELVRRVARALGRPARLVALPPALLRFGGALVGRRDDLARLLDDLVVDSSHIRSTLGWTPPYTLDQGLAELAARLGAAQGASA